MSAKGQAGTGAVTFIVTALIFVAIWALWLGKFLRTEGQRMIATHSLTGIEAFLAANINLVIFLCLCIAGASYVLVINAGGDGF